MQRYRHFHHFGTNLAKAQRRRSDQFIHAFVAEVWPTKSFREDTYTKAFDTRVKLSQIVARNRGLVLPRIQTVGTGDH